MSEKEYKLKTEQMFAKNTILINQLEQAKEIIKKFMKICEENGRQWNEDVYFEAMEFLKES